MKVVARIKKCREGTTNAGPIKPSNIYKKKSDKIKENMVGKILF